MKRTGQWVTVYLLQSDAEPFKGAAVLKLVQEKGNTHDADAIAVMENEVRIGYISNNASKTLLPNTITASQAKDIVDGNEAYVEIDLDSFRAIGQFAYQYRAELLLKEKIIEKKDVIEFVLSGGLTTYPGKKTLQTALSNEQPIILKLIGDKIVGEYNGTLAGYFNVKPEDKEDAELLLQYLEDLPSGVNAIAYGVDKGNILCKVVLKGQVESKVFDLDVSIKRVIDENILSEEEVNERLEYLKKYQVAKKDIAKLLDSMVKYPEHIRARIRKPKTLYADVSGLLPRIIIYINLGKNLRFEGKRGVGKNVLADTLGWLYCRPTFEFSSNSQHSNHSVIGKDTFKSETPEEKAVVKKSFVKILRWLLPKKDFSDDIINGIEKLASKVFSGSKELVFQKSMIIEALEYGGIIVLDEFNSGLADVMTILNSILDDRKRIDIQGCGPVVAHKNFVAIATENKGYAGTFQIHQGTTDRFLPIVFPKPESIASILQARLPNLNYETVIQVTNFYNKLNQSTGISDDSFTVRGFIDACEGFEEGIPLKIALIDAVANRADDLNDREVIKDLIDLLFQ